MDCVKMYNGLKKRRLLDKFQSMVMDSKYPMNLYNFIRDNNIPPSEYKQWARYSYPIEGGFDVKNTQIMAFTKDAYNMPYVPGSSIKGALRNCILNGRLISMRNKDRYAADIENESYDFKGRKAYMSSAERRINTQLFYTLDRDKERRSNAVNDIFHGLRVSDSKPLSIDDLVLCKKTDIFPEGKERDLPIQRECLKPGTVIEFDIEIDTRYFPYDDKAIYKYIELMYNNEKRCFLSEFPDVQSGQGTVLYLGGGSGFVTKTAVYSVFDDTNRAVKVTGRILNNTVPKTGKHLDDQRKYGVSPHMRKCTRYRKKLYDFGLCRLTMTAVD